MSSPIYTPVRQNGFEKENTKGQEKVHHPEPDVIDTRCGIWFFKPGLIQPCANIGLFTAFYSMAGLVSSTLSTYVTSQITTLEKQFGFTSKQTGIIMAANDIGYLVCVLFISYSANRIHIPRSLGLATVIFGISGLACSLPHFIFGASLAADKTESHLNSTLAVAGVAKTSSIFGSLCDTSNITQDSCDGINAHKDLHSVTMASQQVAKTSFVIIVIGMMLQGFGKAPRSSLTVTYLDDNTAKVNTGFYMGIIVTIGILGPAVAFLMGGVFSRIYVTLQPTDLTPRHPKWIGAWWLGYVLFGCLALLVSIPVFCFPRRMPHKGDTKGRIADEKDTETTGNKDWVLNNKTSEHRTSISVFTTKRHSSSSSNRSHTDKFFIRHLKEFLATLLRLVTNPVYVCMVASGCLIIFTVGGSGSYTPKYLERMFHLPAHTANYIIAGQTLCASCLGTFIGGYLTKRLKMTAMKAVKFIIIVVLISFGAQLMGFVFQCDQPDVHNWPRDENNCNNECNCKDNSYFPICGDDGRTYYSPCTAGCGQVRNGVYHNCTCIPGGGAISGACAKSCPHLYAYVTFMGIRSLFGTLSIIPKLVVFIRCVPHRDRPMALGVSSFMSSLLGWLMGPIVFGYIIDGVCTIWDVSCGVTGRCLRYDNFLFRLKLHGFGAVGVACSTVLTIVAYVYARWSKCLDEPMVAHQQVKTAMAEMILMNDHGNDDNTNVSETGGGVISEIHKHEENGQAAENKAYMSINYF